MITTFKQLAAYTYGILVFPILFYLFGTLFVKPGARGSPTPSEWDIILGLMAGGLLMAGFMLGAYSYGDYWEDNPTQTWDERGQDSGHFQASRESRSYAIRTPRWFKTEFTTAICTRCSDILRSSRLLQGSWRIFVPSRAVYDLQDLDPLDSDYAACKLCRLLLSTIGFRELPTVQTDSTKISEAVNHHAYGTFREIAQSGCDHSLSKLHIFEIKGRKSQVCIQLAVPGAQTPVFKIFESSHRLGRNGIYGLSNTGSPLTAQLARDWIANCSRQHAECEKRASLRPRRLLALLEKDMVQVIDTTLTSHVAVSDEYTALSHC